MKHSTILTILFLCTPILPMQNTKPPISEYIAHIIRTKINKGTGPKKLLNVVNRSAHGNLALKAYVIGKTGFRCSNDHITSVKIWKEYEEINQQAQQADDLLALEVKATMDAYLANGGNPLIWSIRKDTLATISFLLQMGETPNADHLALAFFKRDSAVTKLLVNA